MPGFLSFLALIVLIDVRLAIVFAFVWRVSFSDTESLFVAICSWIEMEGLGVDFLVLEMPR